MCKENKQSKVRIRLKQVLEDYGSLELHKKAWVHYDPGVFLPFDDFIEWLNDIICNNPRELINNEELSKKEWNIIEPFYSYLYSDFLKQYYKDNMDKKTPQLLLEYPPWIEVQKKAQETLKKLKGLGW